MDTKICFTESFQQKICSHLRDALERFNSASHANADLNAITFWRQEVLKYVAILDKISATGVR